MGSASKMRYRRRHDVASRSVEGRTVVIVMGTDSLHELNPVGSWLWERWGKECFDPESEARAVCDAFGVSESDARRDLEAYIDELVSVGALEVEER